MIDSNVPVSVPVYVAITQLVPVPAPVTSRKLPMAPRSRSPVTASLSAVAPESSIARCEFSAIVTLFRTDSVPTLARAMMPLFVIAPPIVPVPPSVAPAETVVRPVAGLVAVDQQRAGLDVGGAGVGVVA